MDSRFLIDWLRMHYDVEASAEHCRLLRSYTNDVYLIHAGHASYVLKVYGSGWRTGEEVQYEMDLLRYLAAQGAPVVAPIETRDGGDCSFLRTDTEDRIAALFPFAPGAKPEPPFLPALYTAFGRAIAQVHAAADSFLPRYTRRALDLTHLVDAPLTLVRDLLSEADWDFVRDLGTALKERIQAYADRGLDWGPIHGDASLDNLHVLEDGSVLLYDFDSGGPGWRAADLQGWAARDPAYRAVWAAFHQGYQQIRPLRQWEWDAAPYLTAAWDVWGLQIELERRLLPHGFDAVQAELPILIQALRDRWAAVETL